MDNKYHVISLGTTRDPRAFERKGSWQEWEGAIRKEIGHDQRFGLS
jgi:hypothetical protein